MAGVIPHALLLVMQLCVTLIFAQCYLAHATDKTMAASLFVIATIVQVLIGSLIKHLHSLVCEKA